MREIKFRAWDTEAKRWRYFTLGELWYGEAMKFDAIHSSSWQQYTGLEDKNGKEIYEGDVVRSSDGVDYYNDTVNIHHVHGVMFGKNRYAELGLPEGFEIIGNIYENPELLK